MPEFKDGITPHDVLAYSTKARKHKQVYLYLRYVVFMSEETRVPGRVFTHNEALDNFREHRLHDILASS
jgi:hypothetical protein